jgi:hypothetical protein
MIWAPDSVRAREATVQARRSGFQTMVKPVS